MGIRFKDYLSERRSAPFGPITEEKNEEDQSVEGIAAAILASDNDDSIEEGNTYTSKDGTRVAKVGRKNEWGEHVTKYFKDGKHETKADSHDDHKDDAHDNAKHYTKD